MSGWDDETKQTVVLDERKAQSPVVARVHEVNQQLGKGTPTPPASPIVPGRGDRPNRPVPSLPKDEEEEETPAQPDPLHHKPLPVPPSLHKKALPKPPM